jgi:hypothetical protein
VTRKLRPSERATAPLPQVVREFIDIHLARGASPRAVREVYNQLVAKPREQILKEAPAPWGILKGQMDGKRNWGRLAGLPPLTQVEVRREYDRLRKFDGGKGRLNVNRKNRLAELKNKDLEDARRDAVLMGAPIEKAPSLVRKGRARKLHDLALARRFGIDKDGLYALADKLDVEIPIYLDFF